MKKVNGYEIKPGAKLIGANLENVDLSGMDLSGANLRDANLRGAGLYDSNLTNANLTGANLDGADLSNANLTGANLERAKLTGAFLKGANLENVDLSFLILRGANLEGANLKGANLEGAILIDAKLKGANLFGANLNGANLTGATLSGVDIRGASMTDVIIKGKINLNGTIYNNNTKGLDKYKSRMVFGFNLLVTSEYKNRVIKYNFKINEELPSEVKIQYAFIKKSSAYNKMSLPDWKNNVPKNYDTLTFGKNVEKITKTFKVKDVLISKDLNLDIRIKELKGKITNINGKKFKTQYDFSTTIPKNTGIGFVGGGDVPNDAEAAAVAQQMTGQMAAQQAGQMAAQQAGQMAAQQAGQMAGEMAQPMTNSNISLDTENNTTVGHNAFNINKGRNNTSVGSESMETTTKDSKVNTALGYQALNNVTNLRNIGIGVNAGKDTKKGIDNILIGKNSNVSKINSNNQIVIGNDAKVDDNSILINQKNILPGNNKFNLGHKDYKFDKLYSEKIVNGELELTLPTNKLSGDRYLEVDDKGIIKLVSLKDILSNL